MCHIFFKQQPRRTAYYRKRDLIHRRAISKFILLLGLASVCQSHALTNNLALTPPMGWNDWNTFGCGISETVIQQTADAMATNGMKAAGYQFVNVDDCWASSRDSNGVVVVNATMFIPKVLNWASTPIMELTHVRVQTHPAVTAMNMWMP
jgi:hypothetical protein